MDYLRKKLEELATAAEQGESDSPACRYCEMSCLYCGTCRAPVCFDCLKDKHEDHKLERTFPTCSELEFFKVETYSFISCDNMISARDGAWEMRPYSPLAPSTGNQPQECVVQHMSPPLIYCNCSYEVTCSHAKASVAVCYHCDILCVHYCVDCKLCICGDCWDNRHNDHKLLRILPAYDKSGNLLSTRSENEKFLELKWRREGKHGATEQSSNIKFIGKKPEYWPPPSAALKVENSRSAALTVENSRSATPTVENSWSAASTAENSRSATPTVENSWSAASTVENSRSSTPTVQNSWSATPTAENSRSATPTVENSRSATPTVENSWSAAPTVDNLSSVAPAVDNSRSATPAVENSPSVVYQTHEPHEPAATSRPDESFPLYPPYSSSRRRRSVGSHGTGRSFFPQALPAYPRGVPRPFWEVPGGSGGFGRVPRGYQSAFPRPRMNQQGGGGGASLFQVPSLLNYIPAQRPGVNQPNVGMFQGPPSYHSVGHRPTLSQPAALSQAPPSYTSAGYNPGTNQPQGEVKLQILPAGNDPNVISIDLERDGEVPTINITSSNTSSGSGSKIVLTLSANFPELVIKIRMDK